MLEPQAYELAAATEEATMRMSRREFGALTAATLVFRGQRANAGDPDVFVFGQDLPANLDPHQILDLGMTGYALNAYDNLYRYEDNPPKMQPWLAVSHTSSPDGLVWDFKLRQGVRFHDGSELVADDVVYSVQRLLGIGRAPAAPFLPILKPDSVTAPDRYTVRFMLDQPYSPFFGSTRVLALLNGSLDMTDSFLPVDQVERIEKAPNAHVAKNVTMRLLVIRMNNTKAAVRQHQCAQMLCPRLQLHRVH
jgi:ABC-type transport system substrate-binding protein